MKLVAVLPFLACASVVAAQSGQQSTLSSRAEEPSSLHTLTLSKQVPLGLSSFGYVGVPICDTAGDLFFEVDAPGISAVGQGPFVRVNADGKEHAVFMPPAILTAGSKYGTTSIQAVSPDGSYSLLNYNGKLTNLIKYRNDGSVSSMHSLSLPEQAYPQVFAAADSGTVYVAGYIEIGRGDQPRKSFAGLYAENGEMVADLSAGLKNLFTIF
jgi:hypothetical protein